MSFCTIGSPRTALPLLCGPSEQAAHVAAVMPSPVIQRIAQSCSMKSRFDMYQPRTLLCLT